MEPHTIWGGVKRKEAARIMNLRLRTEYGLLDKTRNNQTQLDTTRHNRTKRHNQTQLDTTRQKWTQLDTTGHTYLYKKNKNNRNGTAYRFWRRNGWRQAVEDITECTALTARQQKQTFSGGRGKCIFLIGEQNARRLSSDMLKLSLWRGVYV
jgi:hypothetical protein